jgi:hypothetical protein
LSGIITGMLAGIDGVLDARDAVGAVIKPVYFLTRTWYSDPGFGVPNNVPEGYAKDAAQVQMIPSPGMKQFNQDIRLREGGSIKAGDIILKAISKNLFKESDLDGSTPAQNIQKFFVIGSKIYQVIDVVEKYVTFNVQVRELTNQTRYP